MLELAWQTTACGSRPRSCPCTFKFCQATKAGGDGSLTYTARTGPAHDEFGTRKLEQRASTVAQLFLPQK